MSYDMEKGKCTTLSNWYDLVMEGRATLFDVVEKEWKIYIRNLFIQYISLLNDSPKKLIRKNSVAFTYWFVTV